MTLISGKCVQEDPISPDKCIIDEREISLSEPFVCEGYLSSLKIGTSSNIVDLSNKPGFTSNYLQQLVKTCDSVFLAVTPMSDSPNIVKLFTLYSQIHSHKNTFLIFLSKKQMKTIAFPKHNLFHFNSGAQMNPSAFEGSIFDDNAIDKFFRFQFEMIGNPVMLQSSDLDIYNENASDDLIISWSQSTPPVNSAFFFIPPLDIRSDQTPSDYITEYMSRQNFIILVLVQKWLTGFDILSSLLHQSNQILSREIEIENVYQGIECWKFDQFCLKLGVNSEYPMFFVFKNQSFIKSFKNGEYSVEKFRKVGHMFHQPAVLHDYQLGAFKSSLTRLQNISDFIIVVVKQHGKPKDDLLLKIGEAYHGSVPVVSTKLSFLPTKIQNLMSSSQGSTVTIAYRASHGWRYLNPKRLDDLGDVEMLEGLVHLYSVNSLTLEELSRFKSEKRQILIHVAARVDFQRLKILKEDLYDTIILKYVDMLDNKEIVKYLRMTSAPALIYADFSTNNIFIKYEGIWGSVYILEWLSSILRGKITPTFNFNNSEKHGVMKPRVFFENKINFGPEEADQSQYYVTNHEAYNYETIEMLDDFMRTSDHDEL